MSKKVGKRQMCAVTCPITYFVSLHSWKEQFHEILVRNLCLRATLCSLYRIVWLKILFYWCCRHLHAVKVSLIRSGMMENLMEASVAKLKNRLAKAKAAPFDRQKTLVLGESAWQINLYESKVCRWKMWSPTQTKILFVRANCRVTRSIATARTAFARSEPTAESSENKNLDGDSTKGNTAGSNSVFFP